jgi:protein SCO1/2
MPWRNPVVVLVIALAGAAGLYVGASVFRAPPPPVLQSGTWLEPPRPLPAFSLRDQDGRPAGPDMLRGRWTLVFFGFTHCPGACPATLAQLAAVRRQLQHAAPPANVPAVVLLSVDPERDSPAVLKEYLAGFGPGFSGLTGDLAAVAGLAAALGVPFRKVPMDGDYMMDHSTAILLVDTEARSRAWLTPPHDTDRLAADLRTILGRGGGL